MNSQTNTVTNAALILRAIAHPTRLAILHLLKTEGNMSVNEMVEATDCEQSLLSHHLSNMKMVGLLKCERQGRYIYYSLSKKEFSNYLLNWIDSYTDLVAKRKLFLHINQLEVA